MTKKNEALRLAEWIESDMSCHGDAEIGAELRRLHAENEAMRNVANRGGHIAVAMSEIDRLHAQRDALLEALRLIAGLIANEEARQKALDAIAKAEGQQ